MCVSILQSYIICLSPMKWRTPVQNSWYPANSAGFVSTLYVFSCDEPLHQNVRVSCKASYTFRLWTLTRWPCFSNWTRKGPSTPEEYVSEHTVVLDFGDWTVREQLTESEMGMSLHFLWKRNPSLPASHIQPVAVNGRSDRDRERGRMRKRGVRVTDRNTEKAQHVKFW